MARPGGYEGRKDGAMLTNEQNLALMNDPRRVAAQSALDEIVRHIHEDIKSNGNAMYYMTVLPPLLKRLKDAYEELAIVEATVEAEIAGKR